MVKSSDRVRQKMLDRMRTAGSELKAGMQAATDPLDVISKDPAGYAKKLQDGIAEAVRRGSYEAGIKKAKSENRWKNSIDTAASRYEQAADVAVERSMNTYEARGRAIEAAKAKVANMPTVTIDQRIAKAAAYAKAVSAEFNTVFGRKA
jgi:hypothetical protein